MTTTAFPLLPFAAVRARLLARDETALLDVREEDPFAQEHPLWAANLPLSRIEIEAWRRIPRRDTFIVLYGAHNGVDLAPLAARTLAAIGYTNLHLLEGGLEGWRAAGGELFRDVNVPSKSFGELVEHERHTPSLSAPEVKALVDAKANVVVLDARRFDEYQTMSIPSATSVPGAELVLRVRELAPDPSTQVIVNCAGRTRSIIGTQSLVNAGIPNPVAALRNGTIGWKLAGQVLDHGASRQAPAVVSQAHRTQAQADAKR
ncbi:MAG: rhodanese-related sulfurtransferase, partial [Variovorax paradoxus]